MKIKYYNTWLNNWLPYNAHTLMCKLFRSNALSYKACINLTWKPPSKLEKHEPSPTKEIITNRDNWQYLKGKLELEGWKFWISAPYNEALVKLRVISSNWIIKNDISKTLILNSTDKIWKKKKWKKHADKI